MASLRFKTDVGVLTVDVPVIDKTALNPFGVAGEMTCRLDDEQISKDRARQILAGVLGKDRAESLL